MRVIFLVLLGFLALEQNCVAQSIFVMTWNIRYNNPNDGLNAWPKRKDWVAEIVVKSKVDIAGFQEVLVDQFHDLTERLPEMQAYGVGRDDGQNAGEFSPIFFRKNRFELIDQGTFWLSTTPEKTGSKGWDAALPRIASWVRLKDRQSGTTLNVINTHFDHRGTKARVESAALLVRKVRETFSEHPVILTGDFNTKVHTPPYNILVGTGTADQPILFDSYDHSAESPKGPNSTWNGFDKIVPNHRIDLVLATKRLKALRVEILEDQREGRFPSDHLPVLTQLELMKE